MNMFGTFPMRPCAKPRYKARVRQIFEKLGALTGCQVVHSQVHRRTVILAANRAVTQVVPL